MLPGRLSFNVLKHLHRASVLRFPRQRTLNPKTLKQPKTVHPKTKTLKPLNPEPENPAFPAVLPAISPIIFRGQIVPVVGAKAAAAVVKVRAAPLGGTLLSDLCGSVLMLLGETSIYFWGF